MVIFFIVLLYAVPYWKIRFGSRDAIPDLIRSFVRFGRTWKCIRETQSFHSITPAFR